MAYTCEIRNIPSRPAITIRTRTPLKNLKQVLDNSFQAIIDYMDEIGEKPAGPPFVIYYNMDMDDLDIEIGFPAAKKLSGIGYVAASETPHGKFLTTMYSGPYSGIESAYTALTEWGTDNKLEMTGVAVESYIDDPKIIPEQELHTQVMFALKKET